MKVSFIDVGYGDSFLFQSGEYTMLLDGGGNLQEEFASDEYRIRSIDYLKSHGINRINSLMISHIHEDHVCGLEAVLNEIPVDCIYTPYPVEPFINAREVLPNQDAPRSVPLYTKALNTYSRIITKAISLNIKVIVVHPGDLINFGPDFSVHVLAPKAKTIDQYMDMVRMVFDINTSQDAVTELLTKLDSSSNATSLLLRIEVEKTTFLMAADCCPREWEEVPKFLLKNVNVLKLPHHGQIDSVKEEYMSGMGLQYVVTTASSDRRYNSSNKQVYEQLIGMYPDEKLNFLFTDEREYPPYFSCPEGFHALVIHNSTGKLENKTEW